MRKIVHIFAISSILFFGSCKNHFDGDKKGENGNLTEENEDGMEKWMEQNRIMTMDPALGYVPYERLAAAQEYTKSLMSNATLRTNALAWTERGPNNVGGRTRAIIVDKRDATGNTVFAGSVGGGIWKCTNFKSSNYSWTLLTPDISNMAITALAQDPSNLNTFYAGTGEGWYNADAINGNGIYKSTDGGQTWVRLASTYNTVTPLASDFTFIQDIVVTNTGIVFVACSGYYCNYGGIQRSTDGGGSWTRVIGVFNGGSCSAAINLRGADLEVAANGDIYATTGFGSTTFPGKIFKTLASMGSNIGASGNWTDVTPAGTWQRIEIATAPSNANVIYALCQNGSTSAIGGIRRSDDGGANWLSFSNPSWCNQGSTSSDFTNSQCWYDLSAAVDPTSATTFFMGGVDMFRTYDGGSNWSQTTQWSGNCGALPNIHADNHNITFIGNSGTDIISGTDGGIYYSGDGGNTWISKNLGYNVTQFYAVDFHPTNTNYFLAGAQDNGSHSLNSNGLGSSTKVTGGDGAYCHIDQTDGVIQVTSYVYNNYYYSRNSGQNFGNVSGGTSNTGWFINPTEYDDALDVLYTSAAANTYGLVSGLGGTGTPTYGSVNLVELAGHRVTAIKVDPNVAAGGTVWFVGYLSSSGPVFVKVSNANSANPTVLASYTPSGFTSGSYINSLDVEKGNPSHLLATVTNYGAFSVLESTDGGNSWTNIEGNLPDMPVHWGIFAPSDGLLTSSTTGGGVILATETGVWCTSTVNGSSTTWTPQNTGLGNVTSYMVKYRSSDRTLVLATHGRGVFTNIIPSVATSVNTIQNTKGFITYASANTSTLFIKSGTLNGVKNMQINILDMQGRTVLTEKTSYSNQSLPINKLPAGGYIIKIYGSNKEQYTQQFVK
jgi:hypothetical protein